MKAQVEMHGSEEALLDALVVAVRSLDPDIIIGWEVRVQVQDSVHLPALACK